MHRRGSARGAGLVIAALMALVSAGVIGYFALFGGARGSGRAVPAPAGEEPPPSLLEMGRSGAGRPGASLQGSTGLSAQIASKSDPTRLAARIVSASLEPLEAKRYFAERPEAFIYLKDGRTLYIRSDTAHLFMPQGETGQPESGTLKDNLKIALYAGRADGREIDPAHDEAEFVLLAPGELTFDLAAGEGRIPERFTCTSRRVDYAGTDLVILYNQPKERLDLVRIARSGPLRIRGDAPDDAPARRTAPQTARAGAGQPAESKAAAAQPPLETFYHAVFQSDVEVVHGPRRVSADLMELWAHLVDNALPAGAIAPLRAPAGSRARSADRPAAAPSALSGAVPDPGDALGGPGPPAAGPPAKGAPEDLVITWSGPLEVRPADQRPDDLGADDLALRFSSSAGSVAFSDPQSGGAGQSQRLHYGATQRELVFEGPAPDGAALSLAGSGQVTGPHIRVNLGTGLATLTGPGLLTGLSPPTEGSSTAEGSPPGRIIQWTDQADFQFAIENGAMTGRLLSAVIGGDVVAADRGAFVQGQTLRAWFEPVAGSTSSNLSRLEVRELVRGDDGRGGALSCDELDVALAPRAGARGRSDPEVLTARGLAAFCREGSMLEGGLIEARLGPDAQGRARVTDVLARQSVRFWRMDGVRAWADELHADVPGEVVDLLGSRAAVAQAGSLVSGSQIRLDGRARTMEVFGAGRFEHEGLPADGAPGERATAKWTRGMVFDDLAGTLECRGEAAAVLFPRPMARRTLEAETVFLELTPSGVPGVLADAGDGGHAARGADGVPAGAAERRLLRARASGSDLEEEGGGPARVETLSYEPDDTAPEGRRLVEAAYLEGSTILADDGAGTLEVPGPGALLVVDRRVEHEQVFGPPLPETMGPSPVGGSTREPMAAQQPLRGDALFRWTESLLVRREEGTMTMRGGVRLIHAGADGAQQTELESRELVARVQEAATSAELSAAVQAPETARRRFQSATATGAVWLRHAGKELTADSVEYDAAARTARASAAGDAVVTMYDPQQPTPVSARVLHWDMARNRVEVKQPATVVIPK